jgi:ketosteroid isomerase-like protein
MAQDEVEIAVRRWFERLAAGDPAPDLCDEDIEIRNWAESPVPGPYRGHDGVRQWFRAVNDPDMGLDIQFFELEEVIGVDDERVVTIQRATGRGRASGLEVDQRWGSIIGVRDGKIAFASGYPTPEQAVEAAGLPELGNKG